jgi:CheY-like chemotaxis protein
MIPNSDRPGILLVEDDPDDVLLLRRALRMAGAEVPLHVVGDGDAAVAYIEGTGEHADRRGSPLPCLVLLDLKLPKRSGLEVLEWLRQQPVLRRLPVIALTSSGQRNDIDRAYDLGVNSYLVKPVQSSALAEMLRHLIKYWGELNCPPGLREERSPPQSPAQSAPEPGQPRS